MRRALPLAPATLVLLLLFAAPLAYFLLISTWSVKARVLRPDFTFANYVKGVEEYGLVLLQTLGLALAVALATTLLAFGLAYAIRFKAGRWASLLLFLTLVTLFGGYLVKIYAWKSILGREGILNQALLGLGLIDEPIEALLYSGQAVVITLTYFLLPFAVLPIYGSLRGVKDATLDAARDLGAGPLRRLLDIVLPQAEPGLFVAFTLAFLIAAGDYVTPRFVGGGAAMMGHFIETQFSLGFNWPLGSAMAFTVLAASLAVVLAARWGLRRALRSPAVA